MIIDFYQLTMIKTFLASESEHKSLHSVFGQQQQLYSKNNIILEKIHANVMFKRWLIKSQKSDNWFLTV